MLEIRLERRAEGLCLEAKGHAGCGMRGRDLVCAGASMLAQTLRAALAEAERAGAGRLEQAQLQSGQGISCSVRGAGMAGRRRFSRRCAPGLPCWPKRRRRQCGWQATFERAVPNRANRIRKGGTPRLRKW